MLSYTLAEASAAASPALSPLNDDGSTDVVPALQAFLDRVAALGGGGAIIEPKSYALNSGPVVVPGGVHVLCSGAPEVYSHPGTRFLHNHNEAAFLFIQPNSKSSSIRDCLIRQSITNLPETYDSNWQPNDIDRAPCIEINTSDVEISNVMFLPAIRGVHVGTSGVGRATIRNLRGTFLIYGINIEGTSDVCNLSGIHIWEYWQNASAEKNKTVWNFRQTNCDGVIFTGADGAWVEDVFVYCARSALRLAGASASRKIIVDGIYADYCKIGALVESADSYMTVDSLTHHGADKLLTPPGTTPQADARAILVQPAAGQSTAGTIVIQVGQMWSRFTVGTAVEFAAGVETSWITIGAASIRGVTQVAGKPIFDTGNAAAASANRIEVATRPRLVEPATPLYFGRTGGTGQLIEPLGLSYEGTAAQVNQLQAASAAAGAAPKLTAAGSDTNIDLRLSPKGTGRIVADRPVQLPSYTIAGLPAAASNPRCIAYVSDGSSNRRFVVSDGTNWRWPDGSIAS